MSFSFNQSKQKIYYAKTSLSDNYDYQLVAVQLTHFDNEPSRFWKTFINALSYWDLHFAQKEMQFGFPYSEESTNLFLTRISKVAQSGPLLLELNNFQRITSADIHAFVDAMNAVQIKGLIVLLLSDHTDSEVLSATIQENKFRYFSLEEERAYYAQHSISLREETFEAIRSFTNGWANAVIILAKHLMDEDKKWLIETDFEAFLVKWIEQSAKEKYTIPELDLFICMSLLDEFPLALLRGLGGWSGRLILDVLESSPSCTGMWKAAGFTIPNRCGNIFCSVRTWFRKSSRSNF